MKKIKTTNVTAVEANTTELDATNSLMNMSQTGNKFNVHMLLFWSIYLLSVVIVSFFIVTFTVKGINAEQLEGAFTEKQYTQADIDKLTATLKERLNKENSTMHTAYGLDMTLEDTYQVYTSSTGEYALVLYNVKFAGKTYNISGTTNINYFTGLMTLLETRNNVIKTGDYKWDNSYIPKDTEVNIPTPTEVPEYTGALEGDLDGNYEDEEESGRGAGAEEEY